MGSDRLHILVVHVNKEIPDMLRLMTGRPSLKFSTQSRVGDFIREDRDIAPSRILMDHHPGWAMDAIGVC